MEGRPKIGSSTSIAAVRRTIAQGGAQRPGFAVGLGNVHPGSVMPSGSAVGGRQGTERSRSGPERGHPPPPGQRQRQSGSPDDISTGITQGGLSMQTPVNLIRSSCDPPKCNRT